MEGKNVQDVAMKLVPKEFASTKDEEAAAAGHVLSRYVKALDRELDEILESAGIQRS